MRRLPGILLLALCLMAPTTGARSLYSDATDNPFIAAMRTMMRMMGLLDEDPQPWLNPFLPTQPVPPSTAWTPGAISPYGMMPGMNPANPTTMMPMNPATIVPGLGGSLTQGLPMTGMQPYYQWGQNWMQAGSQASQSSPSDTPEGRWRGRNGEWLVIARGMFRLYVGRNEYVQGDVRYTDRYISFRNNDNQTVKTYEYAVQDGRMVMKDEDGNLLLFKLQS